MSNTNVDGSEIPLHITTAEEYLDAIDYKRYLNMGASLKTQELEKALTEFIMLGVAWYLLRASRLCQSLSDTALINMSLLGESIEKEHDIIVDKDLIFKKEFWEY